MTLGVLARLAAASAAAIFVRGKVATIQDGTLFDNNESTGSGGAIWVRGAKAVINGATFSNNTASLGGAIAVYGESAAKLSVSNVLFYNNHATSDKSKDGGGALYGAAGAGEVTVSGSTFATASDTARMAFAPRRDLFGVPSRLISNSSILR